MGDALRNKPTLHRPMLLSNRRTTSVFAQMVSESPVSRVLTVIRNTWEHESRILNLLRGRVLDDSRRILSPPGTFFRE